MLPKSVMQHKYLVMILLILIFFAALFSQYYFQIEVESFDVVPIQYADFSHTTVIPGYYQVDASNMAQIPHGYKIDPKNQRNIIPVTQAAKQSLTSTATPPVPAPGKLIPETYYLLNATSLAILPPNMMPNVKSVDVSYNTAPPTLLVYYNTGYVSSTQYYETKYPTPDSVTAVVKANKPPPYSAANPPPAAPPTMYFTDALYLTVAFLPYGKIQDPSNGYGYVGDSHLISQNGKYDFNNTNYKDLANDYDINFHQSAEQIMANASESDVKFTNLSVRDQGGNLVQVPYNPLQGTVTYYQPGSFPFGASTYIPKYEDSVYLSRLTKESQAAPYTPNSGPMGACQKYANLPTQKEEYCRSLDTATCSSTSCCVLLGGSKCVAGSETGPIYKNNYGDFLVRNKDSYYYNGKCYGNCV